MNVDTDPFQISGTSHFSNDLGLDSLDTVEVVMAIEEEFSIEIPDKEADAIHSGMIIHRCRDDFLLTGYSRPGSDLHLRPTRCPLIVDRDIRSKILRN